MAHGVAGVALVPGVVTRCRIAATDAVGQRPRIDGDAATQATVSSAPEIPIPSRNGHPKLHLDVGVWTRHQCREDSTESRQIRERRGWAATDATMAGAGRAASPD